MAAESLQKLRSNIEHDEDVEGGKNGDNESVGLLGAWGKPTHSLPPGLDLSRSASMISSRLGRRRVRFRLKPIFTLLLRSVKMIQDATEVFTESQKLRMRLYARRTGRSALSTRGLARPLASLG